MPIEQRNTYRNLILLCRNHHKVIDAQEREYTVEKLHQMKDTHEAWVRQQLGFDSSKQLDDERYAGIVDEWERLGHLDEWLAWSSHVLGGGQPSMQLEIERDLSLLRSWLLNRVWPGRYSSLNRAFENFRQVLSDFHETFKEHAVQLGDSDTLMTEKFYKIQEWNEEKYRRLFQRFDFHVDLVQDLMLELARAANLVCDRVREFILPSFRIAEGRLVVQTGPTWDFKFHNIVVKYDDEERSRPNPYPGLKAFMVERANRDMHFGKGVRSD